MSSRRSHLISLNNVTKEFVVGGGISRSRLIAVNQVSVEMKIQEPQIMTIAGESGSGKTTLGRLALGLEEPTSGSVTFMGDSLTEVLRKRGPRRHFMENVQPVFQNPFDSFSPLGKIDKYLYETSDNLGRRAAQRRSRKGIIEDALHEVGLDFESIEGRYPNELSGGQLQRISIARAMVSDPKMLVADEPVSMVDASLRISIVNLFRRLKAERGLSVLYITHDLATAYYLSDFVAIMLRGSVVERGPVQNVLDNPLHPYTQLLKESIPDARRSAAWQREIELSGIEREEFHQRGCKFASRCPYVMDRCKVEEPGELRSEGRLVRCYLYDKN